jgi:YVTN family beta-propeller protein
MHFRNLRNLPAIVFAAQALSVGAVSAQPYAYVSNISGNNVSIVNTANSSVVGTVPVPLGPTGLAVTPGGSEVYVACQSANVVAVISTSTNSVIASIGVGATPTQLAISPNGAQVYVVNQGGNQVSVIDTGSKTVVGTIPVGLRPSAVAFNPSGTRAFVANLWSGNVSVIDTSAKAVTSSFTADSGPSGIAVTPDGTRIYVTNQYSGIVSVHDTSGNLLSKVGGFSFPTAVAVTPNGTRVFVTDGNSGTVSVLDANSNTILANIGVASLPTSVVVSADGARAYVTNEQGFSLSIVDTTSNAIVSTIPRVGVYPVAVAVAPAPVIVPPTCSYSIPQGNVSYGAAGGNGTLNVSSPSGCAWTATSNVSWISITAGANGAGNGTVTYSVGSNATASGRSGTISIADQQVVILESGLACTYTLSAGSDSTLAGGGTGSVTLNAPPGCSWNVSSDSAWLTVTSANSGSGNSIITFTTSPNPSTGSRSGNLNIGGQGFVVSQAGLAFSAIRINCGGPSITDPIGNAWAADDQRNRSITTAPIANTNNPAIYQKESWTTGTLGYQFAVPNGSRTVNLHFAEIYLTQPGQRVFNIVINGTTVRSGFDILATAGANTANVQSFNVSVTNGQLIIQLVPVTGTPKLSGIEIL